mmetsp:Transcript_11193/g.45094  ORF Transcript_11193/g.45094 Transcript_11193/m.45094 type:complete len:394 (-) Transcript_11193:606-1787(-)
MIFAPKSLRPSARASPSALVHAEVHGPGRRHDNLSRIPLVRHHSRQQARVHQNLQHPRPQQPADDILLASRQQCLEDAVGEHTFHHPAPEHLLGHLRTIEKRVHELEVEQPGDEPPLGEHPQQLRFFQKHRANPGLHQLHHELTPVRHPPPVRQTRRDQGGHHGHVEEHLPGRPHARDPGEVRGARQLRSLGSHRGDIREDHRADGFKHSLRRVQTRYDLRGVLPQVAIHLFHQRGGNEPAKRRERVPVLRRFPPPRRHRRARLQNLCPGVVRGTFRALRVAVAHALVERRPSKTGYPRLRTSHVHPSLDRHAPRLQQLRHAPRERRRRLSRIHRVVLGSHRQRCESKEPPFGRDVPALERRVRGDVEGEVVKLQGPNDDGARRVHVEVERVA